MSGIRFPFRRQLPRLAALGVVLTLYLLARLPALSGEEASALASQFHFEERTISVLPGSPERGVRNVHPSLQGISAWVSSVGAAASLRDLDGDGFPNDLCLVDPRSDQVIAEQIVVAPKLHPRYAAFALQPQSLPYDASVMAPMGVLPGDFNEDGWPDLMVYYWGRTPILFLNRGSERLSLSAYRECELVAGGERWFTNSATVTDLDGDGHHDLVLGNYYQDGARILEAQGSGSEEMQDSMSRALNGGRKHLLLWEAGSPAPNPTVRFQETKGVLDDPLSRGWTLAMAAGDIDNDGLDDLYLANDFGPDRLLWNHSQAGKLRFTSLEGRRSFTTPASKALGRDSFKGMGCDMRDIDGDGLVDIYVSNIAEANALEESHFVFINTGEFSRMSSGIAPFVDRSEALNLARSRWAWDARLDDFNNDGVYEAVQATGFIRGTINRWPELHETAAQNDTLLKFPATWHNFQPGDDLSGRGHNPFFVRAADGRYYDLAPAIGLGTSQVSRGIATADVDGDGRLDFVLANQWEPSYFYRNESRAGQFLRLRLLLPVRSTGRSALRGRDAVGAVATVHLPNGRFLRAEVDGGNGHSGKRDPTLHFGLGDLPKECTLSVDIRWRNPSGHLCSTQRLLRPGLHTLLLGEPRESS